MSNENVIFDVLIGVASTVAAALGAIAFFSTDAEKQNMEIEKGVPSSHNVVIKNYVHHHYSGQKKTKD